MNVFEPFGQVIDLPRIASHNAGKRSAATKADGSGAMLRRFAIVTFWLVVGAIMSARVMLMMQGNIFNFGS